MRLRIWLAGAAFAACAWAQGVPKDMCAPPPGSVPPSLPARLLSGQGTIDFPITTSSKEAQAFFNQGVAQMHSFWATEAERSFLQAARLDPEAPMPHWGIAMVAAGDYRPRFQLERDTGASGRNEKPKPVSRQPSTGGRARAEDAVRKALELSAVPGKATELEKLYVAAIAARRDANQADPDAAYVAGLRAILAAYPDQVEAKSYLALHLMRGFTTPEKRPREGSMEAAALLRELMRDAPDHAGVHHYVIHGFEGSTFAEDAWESCRRYPELADNIPHALHMPGHVWAQTGKWREAVDSFETAAANERKWMASDSLYGAGHHGHNVHFLASSYAFLGEHDKAMAAARELLGIAETPREAAQIDNFRTAYRQGWFATLVALVHAERWDLLLDGQTLPAYDKPRERAWRHWAEGLAYAVQGDRRSAKRSAKSMDRAMKELGKKTGTLPPALAAARKELEAHVVFHSGKQARGFALFEQASRMERALRYNEPPSYPRPVAEAWGRKAMAGGRHDMAEKAFRIALEQFPDMKRAREGLAQAQRGEGAPVPSGN
ncbi:MAG: hypothetical protein IPM24_14980 [Bryobacterales bacterium]|nr:hypothetical protein [Bryobacterales bacterium]